MWSIKATTCTPRSARTDSSRFTVSSTEYLLATCKRPLPCITSPLELGSLARPSLARKMLSRPALASLLWNPLPQDLLQNLRCHCSSHSRNILRRVVLHEVCADNRTLNRVQMSNGLPHRHAARLAMRDSRRKRRVELIYVERNINWAIDLELLMRGKGP